MKLYLLIGILTIGFSLGIPASYGQFPENKYLTAPAEFTPDIDGKQNTWQITWKQPVDSGKIEIYSRWGERILSTTNKDIIWDGKDDKGKQWDIEKAPAKEALVCIVTIWVNKKKIILKGLINYQDPGALPFPVN